MGSGSQTQNQSTTGSQAYYNSSNPQDWAYQAAQAALAAGQYLGPNYNPGVPYPYLSQLPATYSPEEYWYNAVNPSPTDYMTWGDINHPTITSQIAPMNEQQKASLQQIANWANAPNQMINTANEQLVNTMGGGYLNPQTNPFLAAYANQAMGDVSNNFLNSVMPQLQSSAQRAGAGLGSADALLQGEAMSAFGDTLAKTAAQIYNPAYESERQRMMQAGLVAPQLANLPLQQATAGLGVGDAYQQYEQAKINNLVQQWQQLVQWPYWAFQASTGGAVPWMSGYGISGGGQNYSQNTTASTSGGGGSPLSNIFGGAMSGIGSGLMASAAGLNPFAAGGVGGLAALSSIF